MRGGGHRWIFERLGVGWWKPRRLQHSVFRFRNWQPIRRCGSRKGYHRYFFLIRAASTITTGDTFLLHATPCILHFAEPTLTSPSRRCFSAQPQRAILCAYPGAEEGAIPAL